MSAKRDSVNRGITVVNFIKYTKHYKRVTISRYLNCFYLIYFMNYGVRLGV